MTQATLSSKRTVYAYRNADGSEYCQVIRIDKPDGAKDIFTLPSGLPGPHPVYRAERLASLPTETPIHIVEGEKCVEALEAIGLASITSKGGAGGAHKTDWQIVSRFNHVIILPDADEPGAKYAATVIEMLAALPGQRRVDVCELPGLPTGGDVADYLEEHGPEATTAAIAEYARAVDAASIESDEWPEPKRVSSVLSVVPEVRKEMLPNSISPWCFDAADRMQCPVDYVAISAITMLGALIGRQLSIRPKALDSWSVKPNLWACLVGPPAAMKSPALKEARRFVDIIDREAAQEYKDAMATFERHRILHDATVQSAKVKLKTAKTDTAREDIVVNMPDAPDEPIRARAYSQDSTCEKLQVLLEQNPRGLLVMRDELTGFLRGLDKPGQEGSRAFFLEAWEGNGRFLVDRIGRGSSVIDGVCLSVLGCATPGGMSDYVGEALGNGEGADGLLQRFSMIAFPDTREDFRYMDRPPDSHAAFEAEQAFRACNDVDVELVGATCYDDTLPFLRYDDHAQSLFRRWYTELVTRCRRDDDHPAIQSHLLKFSKLVPALSLIFHVADRGIGPIPERCFLMAAAWADYAEGHARRLYESAFSDQAVHGATMLLRHIEAGDLEDGFTVRNAYRNAWTGLSDQESVQAAVDELVETGHLRMTRDIKAGGGRPTCRYRIHPQYRSADHE